MERLPAETRKFFLQQEMESLVHIWSSEKKCATDLHLQSKVSDRDLGEKPTKQIVELTAKKKSHFNIVYFTLFPNITMTTTV